MVHTPVSQSALEKILDLPGTKAIEYTNGRIAPKPLPQVHHSIILRQLLFAIDPVLNELDIAQAFPSLHCTFGDRSMVADVAIYEDINIATDARGNIDSIFTISPDWIIIILPPDRNITTALKNINYCLANGTQMGWLVDPIERCVFISEVDRTFELIEEPNTILPVPLFATSIELTISQLFGAIEKNYQQLKPNNR
jgi:Uma2 family endonuclease